MSKTIESWDLDEVCIWLNCIGLGEKVDPFRENTVDGETLTSLSNEDLTAELGLTNLQANKVLRQIDETKEMISLREGSALAASGESHNNEELQVEIQQLKDKLEAKDANIASLEEKNGSLQGEVSKLKAQMEKLSHASGESQPQTQQAHHQYPPQGYAYPPPQGYPQQQGYPATPEQQAPPKPERPAPQGPGVIGGAARGAAGGALKGAVMGAILPGMDAGDGAAAGAAVGALGGAGRGLLGRRRR